MQKEKPVFYTAAELTARGSNDIPRELVSTTHLIYSSPATLALTRPVRRVMGSSAQALPFPVRSC